MLIWNKDIVAGLFNVSVLKCLFITVIMFPSVEAKAEENVEIFDLGGYRLGAYPNEHEENVDAKRMPLSKPFLDYEAIEPIYSHGRLYKISLYCSKALSPRDRMNALLKIYPTLHITKEERSRIFAENDDVKVGVSERSIYATVNGDGLCYGEPDPFAAPKTRPIDSIFGVSTGLAINQYSNTVSTSTGINLTKIKEYCGDATYRFTPKKKFMSYEDYFVKTKNKIIVEVTAKRKIPPREPVQRAAYTSYEHNANRVRFNNWKREMQETDETMHTVVSLLKEKYKISFTWKGSREDSLTAEYYGSADDFTMLKVDRSTITLGIDIARRDAMRRQKKIVNEMNRRGAKTNKENYKRQQALDAL